jgi:Transposase
LYWRSGTLALIRKTLSLPQRQLFAEDFCGAVPRLATGSCSAYRTAQGLLRQVAFEVSAEAAHRLVQYFQIVSSGDTLLRIIRQTPAVLIGSPRIIGVDDWALKKGRRYGTVVVDLEEHRPIDLLLERTAAVVTAWLQQHPVLRLSRVTAQQSTQRVSKQAHPRQCK